MSRALLLLLLLKPSRVCIYMYIPRCGAGYREHATIHDDVCILSVSGTAAVIRWTPPLPKQGGLTSSAYPSSASTAIDQGQVKEESSSSSHRHHVYAVVRSVLTSSSHALRSTDAFEQE